MDAMLKNYFHYYLLLFLGDECNKWRIIPKGY